MLRHRVPSAIAIVIAAVIPAVLGHPVLTVALIVLATLGIVEFCRAAESLGARPFTWQAILIVAALVAVLGSGLSLVLALAIIILGPIALLIFAMIRGSISGSTRDYAFSIVAIIYIGAPVAHMSMIRAHDAGSDPVASWLQRVNDLSVSSEPATGLAWLVMIVAITWITDSAAYLGGRAFGSHKLAPTLSPGKTVEGAIVGVLAGVLTGVAFAMLLGLDIPIYVGAAIGLLLSALGQAGDLAESLIKRDLGIKDMGNIIPGHGGILDRIDALLFTLPAGYYLMLVATEVSWP
jgi:phosphatidate cytidylyltransferase